MIHVNTDLSQSVSTTGITETSGDVHVDCLAAFAKKFKSLYSSDTLSIKRQKSEAHLNEHILHSIVTGQELNIHWLQKIIFLLLSFVLLTFSDQVLGICIFVNMIVQIVLGNPLTTVFFIVKIIFVLIFFLLLLS